MNTTSNEAFTKQVSGYLNTFINAIENDRDNLLKKLDEFPGRYHLLIKQAIEEGPQSLPKDDIAVCKEVFAFIEFYATGSISDNIDIENAKKE